MRSGFGYLVFVVIILLVIIVSMVVVYSNSHVYVGTVTDKTRIVRNNGSESYYLIFTELDNGETRVFKDEDAFFKGKWNSSDIYGDLKIGHRYIFKVYGFRVPFLSWYENITKIHEAFPGS